MKKLLIALVTVCCLSTPAMADEGMWLLPMLNKNLKDMKSKGLKLSVKDIYDVNNSSLKDAIVIFGNGCTGEIVSADGLLFTNHHCGYGNIQALSSVEHDYLKDGFWARSRQDEIPAPGLAVTFIRHIEDVTDIITDSVDINTPQNERDRAVNEKIKQLKEQKEAENEGIDVVIKPFMGGNQYIMFFNEVYKDVRFVGAPPSSIGKFGGETDNWMWPRHTGDFSVFRVYADKDGKPAEYAKDNVPYKADKHLKISLKGYKEGDFAMIMGFPGSTNRYMTSYEIDQLLESTHPARIFIRGERQDVLAKEMAASDEIRIKYANKYANSSNYWKNSIGMSRALRKLDVKNQKQDLEARFTQWANASEERAVYRTALPKIKEAVEGRTPPQRISLLLSETLLGGVDLISFSRMWKMFTGSEADGGEDFVNKIIKSATPMYKDYDENVDRKVAKEMFKIVMDSLPEAFPGNLLTIYEEEFNSDIDKFTDYIFDNSVFANFDKLISYAKAGDYTYIENDPAVEIVQDVMTVLNSNGMQSRNYGLLFNEGHRLFVAGLQEMEKGEIFYPDANFTIRLTYGNILPYSPADAVDYDYYTTLTGVMEKEDDSNPVEFTVPDKLKQLYYSKDFGRYAYKGDVPVAFISNNDITGGNSGSPVLNGRGELIGLAFDGNWEAMSGDIAFETNLQRCINVDIRYVLFIIEKYGNAGYLLDEMTIVK